MATVTDDAVTPIEEVVADKGYHSRTTVHDLETLEIRTYISEPDRGSQSRIDQRAERDAVYANRRRIRGARGTRLLRRRGELLERPYAHLYETGGLRRAHVRGHENVLKRLLVHASAFNLGLWMRRLFGVGTPRALQGRAVAAAIPFIEDETDPLERRMPRRSVSFYDVGVTRRQAFRHGKVGSLKSRSNEE